MARGAARGGRRASLRDRQPPGSDSLQGPAAAAGPPRLPALFTPGRDSAEPAVIIIPAAFFLPGYLFFCEEGMWGIYHRALAFTFAAWPLL